MSRPTNPFRIIVQQVAPQLIKSKNKVGEDILIMHFQISEDQPIPLMSFAIRFESVKDIEDFMVPFMNKAAEIWPDNSDMQMYIKDDFPEDKICPECLKKNGSHLWSCNIGNKEH